MTGVEPTVSPAAATATVFLVRHGRTALNAAGVLRGQLDPPLDDVGRGEAGRLAELFRGAALNRIVSSPLVRAVETAQLISAACGLPVTVEDALIDRDYGPVAGRDRGEVEKTTGPLGSIEGVEAQDQLAHRVMAAFERLTATAANERVLAVAHDAVNRTLIASLAPADFEDVELIPQRTGCWNRIRRVAGAWRVEIVDAVPGEGNAL
ncbi:MAG TPA: histidine phosphatase family protein [Acidimicrobiales bacterium]|nr:histidine phosphatase family protein [Acidimicrobiales bacterium]